MAGTWGSTWGASWGSSWGSAAAVVPIAATRRFGAISPDLARQLDRDAEEREQARLDSQQLLRDAIDKAFKVANGEWVEEAEPLPLVEALAMEETLPGFDDMRAAMDQAALVQAQLDEEALELLLLAA